MPKFVSPCLPLSVMACLDLADDVSLYKKKQYLAAHGGHANAFTATDHTNY
jgi:hypothetical protein